MSSNQPWRTVFGEPVEVLLKRLAECADDQRVVGALLQLTLRVPEQTSGALRRALLRAEAAELRREADALGDDPYVPRTKELLESAALANVARGIAQLAHENGLVCETVAERAVVHGQIA